MTDILDLTGQGMDDVPELRLADANEEYQIRIINIIQGTDKNDDDYIMPFFEIIDEPEIQEFSKYMSLPNQETQTKKDFDNARRDLNDFAACFNFSWGTPVSLTDLKGEAGWAILGKSKGNDEYGPQNTVKQFIAPK